MDKFCRQQKDLPHKRCSSRREGGWVIAESHQCSALLSCLGILLKAAVSTHAHAHAPPHHPHAIATVTDYRPCTITPIGRRLKPLPCLHPRRRQQRQQRILSPPPTLTKAPPRRDLLHPLRIIMAPTTIMTPTWLVELQRQFIEGEDCDVTLRVNIELPQAKRMRQGGDGTAATTAAAAAGGATTTTHRRYPVPFTFPQVPLALLQGSAQRCLRRESAKDSGDHAGG